jgi:ABC-type bacteriocin/lantibiotic exporter with double-glycine peptidase domain
LCSEFLLGWKAALAGFATSLIMIPLNVIVSKYLREITIANMKNRTTRIKKTNELLNGMKVIKLGIDPRVGRGFVGL